MTVGYTKKLSFCDLLLHPISLEGRTMNAYCLYDVEKCIPEMA
jgi:hypothetical protein